MAALRFGTSCREKESPQMLNASSSLNYPKGAGGVKVYGRAKAHPEVLLPLQEVSFLVGPEQLRSLAHFFLAQADSQESGRGRDHEHYLDSAGAIQGEVEVVVADPAAFSK